jgi:CheY-like chemotaxis protein
MPKKLLVADDSVTIQRAVAITFAKEDFVLVTAKSGEEALAKARDQKPDVILCDVAMPAPNGYDVCAQLRSDGSLNGVPVLLLGGISNPVDEAKVREVGATGHIVKPFDTQGLIDRVKQALGAQPTAGKAAAAPAAAAAVAAARGSAPAPAAAAAPAAPRPTVPTPGPTAAAAAQRSMTMVGIGMPAMNPPTPAPRSAPVPGAAGPGMAAPTPAAAKPAAAPAPAPAPAAAKPAPAPAPTPAAIRQQVNTPVPVSAPLGAAPAAAAASLSGPEHELLARMTREVIERIVWEIVPELAETMIKQELEKVMRERKGL